MRTVSGIPPRMFCLFSLCLFSIATGCGGAGDDRVSVVGVIEVDGKPVGGVTVAFIGGGGGALATASTDKSGRFQIRVAKGQNKVTVSKVDEEQLVAMKPLKEEDTLMGTDAQVQAMAAKAPKGLIAPRFADPEKSGLQFDIKSGMPELRISVTSK